MATTLVRDVVYPLATPKAVDLLERCLGQREVVIWRALGENWLNPNVREPHDVAPYSPRFHKTESLGSNHVLDWTKMTRSFFMLFDKSLPLVSNYYFIFSDMPLKRMSLFLNVYP